MIQSLINIFYRNPKSALNKYSRFGGYANYRRMLHGNAMMKKASVNLPPVISYPEGLPIYFLTGEKYLYQTLFCIQSLQKVTTEKFRFVLVDDGSFDAVIVQRIKDQLPGSEIFTSAVIEENLKKLLPEQSFTALHNKRKVYPHIKKLTDVHTLPGNNWKLVLDSDMLFWASPDRMIDWLKQPDKPIYMLDCQNSYGYTKELMEILCGKQIPDLLNVGAIGLNSEKIDWAALNRWVVVLEEKQGTSYYLEQALTAMLIGETGTVALPAHDYIVNPDTGAITHKKGILHHYVDLSKEGYFKQAWKMV